MINVKTIKNDQENVQMIEHEVQSNGTVVEIEVETEVEIEVNPIESVVENQVLKNQDRKMLRKKNLKEEDQGHLEIGNLKSRVKGRNHGSDRVEGAKPDRVQKISTVLMKLLEQEIFLKKKLKRKR